MEWTTLILMTVIFLLVLYKYGMRRSNYWQEKGVKQTKQWIPFVGDFYISLFGILDPVKASQKLYDFFKGEKFGGIFIFQSPMLLVRDPDLLKQIMIKDAEYFVDRYDWATETDPLMKKNLSALKGEEWRNLRMVMTTVFTASKMKDMFTFMDKCGRQSVEYIISKSNEQIKNSGKEVYTLELKDYFSRYGTDVIASTAFGIEMNSFENPNNEFFETGSVISKGFTGWGAIKMMLIMIFPKISRLLGITFFGNKLNNFFRRTVNENIRYREENNIVRKDVIHILMEARKEKQVGENFDLVKGKLPDLLNDDITAQAMVFYFGGYETMASMMGFLSYELAINPEVQKNLHEEIDSVIEAENGITYDGVMNQMRYLDMVIHETMRKYPPVTMTDRIITKPYTIPKTESSPEVKLDFEDIIWIPIAALHYDPENFPNPEKFDPERFRNEKETIKPFTYLPFGAGLRHCIGMRYALMEAKTGLVHLLRQFEIVPVKETEIPMKFEERGFFLLRPKNGFWLGLKPRN